MAHSLYKIRTIVPHHAAPCWVFHKQVGQPTRYHSSVALIWAGVVETVKTVETVE